MIDGLCDFIERTVMIPLWLFLFVAGKFGYDVLEVFGLF